MVTRKLTDIIIYPVKSLRGISLDSAHAGMKGFEYDRRWMLVDEEGHFLTQRTLPVLATLEIKNDKEGWIIQHKQEHLKVPFDLSDVPKLNAEIWGDLLEVSLAPDYFGEWFSDHLKIKCHLVYMGENLKRMVDERYRTNKEMVSFADAFPYLLIGESSLHDLNSKLVNPVPMNRFRPNLVFSGGEPFSEDSFDRIETGEAVFRAVKPCTRCVVTTTDQLSGIRGSEPLLTLSKYRKKGNHVFFGQNLVCLKEGKVKIGDTLHLSALS